MPANIIRKINADVNEVVKSREVTDQFAAQGAEPYLRSPQEFAAVVKADIDQWGKVVKASGANLD